MAKFYLLFSAHSLEYNPRRILLVLLNDELIDNRQKTVIKSMCVWGRMFDRSSSIFHSKSRPRVLTAKNFTFTNGRLFFHLVYFLTQSAILRPMLIIIMQYRIRQYDSKSSKSNIKGERGASLALYNILQPRKNRLFSSTRFPNAISS